MYRLGVDVGGTFTDIVLLGSDGLIYSLKTPSTPGNYSRGIVTGIREVLTLAGIDGSAILEVAHGTTVATNTIIERKGARTALVTTRGFRDVLEFGRFRIPRLYDFGWQRPAPIVAREQRFEVDERVNAAGTVLEELDTSKLAQLITSLEESRVESLAICLLHSYANSAHEEQLAEYIRAGLPDLSISVSHEVLPQAQEYERTSTVVINAYVRPIVEAYISDLERGLKQLGIDAPLQIMQSNGGVMPARKAAEVPIYIIESGPAAGVVGANRTLSPEDVKRVITLDMGGTTAKASVIEDGEYSISGEQEVGGELTTGHRLITGSGFVVRVPTIDIAEVGAGGGSVAWSDEAGGLHVGPESSGAEPGPICYRRGGRRPTVTDANLVLGYLSPEGLLGGTMGLDREAAESAFAELGRPLGLSAIETAFGVFSVANSTMMRAVKSVTTERGRDPRLFTLFAMGGSGPIHAVGMAEALGIDRVVVPPVPGVFSALGILTAKTESHLVRAHYCALDKCDISLLGSDIEGIKGRATSLLSSSKVGERGGLRITVYAQMQYRGQNGTLDIPLHEPPQTQAELAALAERFHEAHESSYGYGSPTDTVQLVALKATAIGDPSDTRVPSALIPARHESETERTGRAYFGPEHGWLETRFVSRASVADEPVNGPAIIEEYDSNTVVPPGWNAWHGARSGLYVQRVRKSEDNND